MSGSTVAVAAANPNSATASLTMGTRKRNVVVSEKKTSNVEIMVSSQQEQQQSSDRSHSTSLLDKPPSALQINNNNNNKKIGGIVTSTASPRRTRKAVSKPPEKPRWQIVLSVLSKNFLLLLILLGLVQLIRKLTIDASTTTTTTTTLSSAGVSDFEGRIAEVDSLLKKTTKMMQVQLEVVDQKIETEVGSVRRDFIKKFDHVLESGLKKLEARTGGLEKSFSEFRSYKFLTKDDLQQFSDEFKDRAKSSNGNHLSLDEIRAVAREIVEKEIERHAADGLARVDYALASGGARVVSYSETHSHMSNGYWFNSVRRQTTETAAQKMLQPSFGEPGHCFALKGSNGFVVIRLRQPIVPDAFTLEHVAKSVAYDRSSAPKDCRITGWLRREDSVHSGQTDDQFLLAEFTYDLERSNAQTFNVESKDSRIVDMVRLDFNSNHGAPHTCIYRLRVHGHELDLVAISALKA